MDFILRLRGLLDPFIKNTSFILDEVHPLTTEDSMQGILEYHGTLSDGRIVLFGFYQRSAQQTVTAEMWVPDETMRLGPDVSIDSVARRRRVWSYDGRADGENLVRAIVAEVVTWLQSFASTCELDADRPSCDA